MKYFLDSVEAKVIALDENGAARVLEEIGITGGGVERKKREPKEKDPSTKSKLTPETMNKVKELLNLGTSVLEIQEETGVSKPTIYKIKKTLE